MDNIKEGQCGNQSVDELSACEIEDNKADFLFKGYTYLNEGDKVECLEVKINQGGLLLIDIKFNINGEIVQRFLTSHTLWLGICDFIKNRIIPIKDSDVNYNTT